jgi:hypothetical protein
MSASITYTGLNPSTGYMVSVKYQDSFGGWSRWSAPVDLDLLNCPHRTGKCACLSIPVLRPRMKVRRALRGLLTRDTHCVPAVFAALTPHQLGIFKDNDWTAMLRHPDPEVRLAAMTAMARGKR